jgi:hypothetical protein
MTEDEIFEKRAEHWRFYHRSAPTSASHDVMLFLERLEKVTKERDMAVEQHRLSQHEVARWVDRETKAVRERDEARADASTAYRRGAEAMRDECIGAACGFFMGTTGFCNGDEDELEAVLEALPIPEEPTNG